MRCINSYTKIKMNFVSKSLEDKKSAYTFKHENKLCD